jgi:hypothetical protein
MIENKGLSTFLLIAFFIPQRNPGFAQSGRPRRRVIRLSIPGRRQT